MLMRRTTPLPIVANEMETTSHGHIAILPDGSFAMTRAHGGPLVATFYDDLMEAINHVGARIGVPVSPAAPMVTPTELAAQQQAPISAAELAAQQQAPLTTAEQTLANQIATVVVATTPKGLTPGAPVTRAATHVAAAPVVAAPVAAAPVAASTATPAALTPAEQALAAHITSTIQTP